MKTNRKKKLAHPHSFFDTCLPVRRVLNLAILAILYPSFSYAVLDGAEIVNGQVSIDSATPGVTTVTNSPNAIIQWQNFSIAQNELVQFIQQNGQSAVLNRIIGQNPSEILGQLYSNGKVFLINPNGIIFGAGSTIDTQGLIASSLNLSDQDFLSGNYHFMAGSSAGNIVNEGIIRAGKDGNVILIAPQIENNGIIKTDGGSITLAAGQELTITNLDDPDIRFQVQAPADSAINLGKLLTEGGAVNVFANSIKHSGEINADSVEVDAQGNVRLVAQQDITLEANSKLSANNSAGDAGTIHIESKTGTTLAYGTIEARSTPLTAGSSTSLPSTSLRTGKGGHINLLGEQVGVLDKAKIDASGENGGGQILIGGDYQGGRILSGVEGSGVEGHNAKAVYIGKDTTVQADAKTQGDGGKIIAWSDEATRAYGNISAKGGSQQGNGGFIETSGHWLDVEGAIVDASAPNGESGKWLLDPNNVIIKATGANTNVSGNPNFTTTSDSAVITTGTIQTALNAGTSVDITTGTGAPDTEAGDITVSSPISKTAGTDAILSLTAHNDININASITSSVGKLNMVFDADSESNGAGAINLANGANITLDTNGGTIDASSEAVNLSSGIANINSTFNIGGALGGTGAVNVGAGAMLSLNGGNFAGVFFDVASGATLTFKGIEPVFNTGSKIDGDGLIDFNITGNLALPTINANSLQAISTGDLSQNGSIKVGSGEDIVLVAGGKYLNNIGTTAFNVSGGRWLVYSNSWTTSTEEGLSGATGSSHPRLYGKIYDPLASIEAGNHLIYATQPSVTITADAQQTKVYGSTDPLLTYGSSGWVDDDATKDLAANYINGSLVRAPGENVPISSYTIDKGSLASDNYTINYIGGNFDITPAPLTVTANDVNNRPYDGLPYDDKPGVTFSAFANNETEAVITGTLNYAFSGNHKDAETYTITPSGLSTSNYDITFIDGKLTIIPVVINLSITRDYDGTKDIVAETYTQSTQIGAETLKINYSGTVPNKNVETDKPLTLNNFELIDDTGRKENYTLEGGIHTATIIKTADPVILTTTDVIKTYDGNLTANGTATYSVGSLKLLPGDSFEGGTFAYTSKDAGQSNKVVTIKDVMLKDSNSGNIYNISNNYNISYVNNETSTIHQRPVNLTGNREYDGTNSVSADIFTLGNLVPDETLTLSGTGSVASEHVLAGNQLVARGSLDLGNDNYTFDGGTQIASITRRDSVTWNGNVKIGNWSDPNNWIGGIPTTRNDVRSVNIPSDITVIYDANTSLENITSNGTLNISGGTLIADNFTSANYTQLDGTVSANSFIINNAFNQAGGSLIAKNFTTNEFTQSGGNVGAVNFNTNTAFNQTGGIVTANNATINTSNDLVQGALGKILVATNLTVNSGGNVNLIGNNFIINTLDITAEKNVALAAAPLTINGEVTSNDGNISLTANNSDILTVNAPINAPKGTITLKGGTLAGSYADKYAQHFNNPSTPDTPNTPDTPSDTIVENSLDGVAAVVLGTTSQAGQTVLTDEPVSDNNTNEFTGSTTEKSKKTKQCTK